MIDNRYAILFIRGELPIMDLKYDIMKHPNVALTADGSAGVYSHGEVRDDVATIEVKWIDPKTVPDMEVSETTYELLSDFIFGLIRAIGLILLGFGIVQVGLSLKSHDPSQRANGFLTLAGGVIITFAKEILTLITG